MTADMSIRPTAPAELPSLAHVTNHEDRNRRENPQQRRKNKAKHPPVQSQADEEHEASRGGSEDDPTSTIDLLA